MRVITAIIIVFATFSFIFFRSEPAPSKPFTAIASAKQLVLTVTGTSRARLGSPFVLTCTIRNTGEEMPNYGHIGEDCEFFVWVLDSKGRYVARTPNGMSVAQDRTVTKSELRYLEPGAVLSQSYDLMRIFDLRKGNSYTIVVRKMFNENIADSSLIHEIAVDSIRFDVD